MRFFFDNHKRKKGIVLIVGPGKNTRGGITSVIRAHQDSDLCQKWNLKWIETYVDKTAFHKILFFIRSLIYFLFLINRASLVHIHFSGGTSIRRKSVYFYLSRIARKKTILHLHTFSPETSLFGPSSKLYLELLTKADGILVLSRFWKDQVAELIGESKKIKILFNPCPIVRNVDYEERRNTILYAGTLNDRKGFKDLIKAFSQIKSEARDWKIIFAGNGEIEKGKDLAESLNVIEQVEFLGWVSGSRKIDQFKSASIFCLPSYAEGFPMAVLDAWAYGIPVITTPVGGLPDIVDNGKNSLFFEPGEIEMLSNCLRQLICSSELREKISKESFALSKGLFSIDTIANELDEYYREILRIETVH